MIFVKDLRLLIFGVNVICLVVWLALTLIWIFLINLKSYLIFGIIFNFLLIFILRLFTRRQRQIVSNWEKWHEIEKIKKKIQIFNDPYQFFTDLPHHHQEFEEVIGHREAY